jgi:uncharacterized membrane protein
MKNRIVGFIIIGLAALMGFVIILFNRALTSIVNTACSHGPSCPMWGTINFHTNISIGITSFVVLIGLYLIFFGKEEKIITKIKEVEKPQKDEKVDYSKIMKKLNSDEKLILETIINAEGTIFQSDLVEKTDLSKVKVTRILDKLEGKGILERRRRGMTNVVILKHKK